MRIREGEGGEGGRERKRESERKRGGGGKLNSVLSIVKSNHVTSSIARVVLTKQSTTVP